MKDALPSTKRPQEWGRLTWIRDAIARSLAAVPSACGLQPAYHCTIVKLDHLGDFVLACRAIQRLLDHFGETRCILVISPEAKPLAAALFPRTPLCVLPATAVGLFREIVPRVISWRSKLRRLNCQHLVCLRHQRSLYRDLVLRWIPCEIMWRLDGSPFGDRDIIELPDAIGMYPAISGGGIWPLELLAHARLLTSILHSPVAAVNIVPKIAHEFVQSEQTYIVVAPLAFDPIRNLDPTKVWELLAALAPLQQARVIFIGSASQNQQLAEYVTSAPPQWKQNCEIRTGESIRIWLQLLRNARLTLSADSASAHLATALDVPLVATLGGGHPGIFAPWRNSSRQQWVAHPLACYGCDWHCPHTQPICLSQISIPALVAAAQTAMENKPAA